MCGRYVTPAQAEIERLYRVDRSNSKSRLQFGSEALTANYNVTPSTAVPVVRAIRDRQGERELLEMRWGLVPFWAKGMAPTYSTINATIEKLISAPTWRGPWRRGQRCIMPCSGFYEWHENADGGKTPYYIYPSGDAELFSMAAIWDESTSNAGETIVSCAIITLPANELLARIHNAKPRMPAILEESDIDCWLSGTPEQAMTVLNQYPAELMRAHAVSKRVNSPKNNGPALIQPLPHAAA